MTRRTVAALGSLSPAVLLASTGRAPQSKPRIGAVVSEYRWYSHADVICGRVLDGYSANGIWTPSRMQLVAVHTDQIPANDMSRDMAARAGFKICPTIADALTAATGKLAVDGVLFICELGDYPRNADGQKLYPRFEQFSQILDIYEAAGRGVPTFFDKHFSYDWTKAEKLFQRARRLRFPLMAGSSAPLGPRTHDYFPELETPMTAAAAIGNGAIEDYGFHLLEVAQSLIERRKGGETGIAEVEYISGSDIWQWCDSARGAWSKPLLEAAHFAAPDPRPSRLEDAKDAALFRLRYNDGFQLAAIQIPEADPARKVAIRIPGRAAPVSTAFDVRVGRPLPHFDGLVHCIDEMMNTGKEPYPPERTLLTTGALALCFDAKRARQALDTPQLNIRYRAVENTYYQTH